MELYLFHLEHKLVVSCVVCLQVALEGLLHLWPLGLQVQVQVQVQFVQRLVFVGYREKVVLQERLILLGTVNALNIFAHVED